MSDSLNSMMLLERDEALAALSGAAALARSAGRLVTICGEAGIGKSSLLQAFARREARSVECLWGGCDALGTPRPLGPLLDMAPHISGHTSDLLAASAPRHEVFSAFVADLSRREHVVAAIFEDVHWADEATLDLLKYVGRRIHRTRALLIVSWRDDEVNVDHAIHRVLGDWPHQSVHRIQLEPLSLEGVRTLAAGSRDAAAVHAATGGNPFFVTEVLGAVAEGVPASVREAVLARRARLDADARAVLDLVSVVPSRAETDLVEAALDPPLGALERCVTAGLLRSELGAVSFRHELARMAVVSALPVLRVQEYHRRVLDVLLAHPDRDKLLARIVHHAEAAGAVDAVVAHAPAAARQAASLGAHLQAVEHYRRALQYGQRSSDEAKAMLLEALAYEHYLTGDIEGARDARQHALSLWKRLNVPFGIGRNVRWLSRLAWFLAERIEADRRADEAIEVLSGLPEGDELAMAYSNRSQLDMLSGDTDRCIAWGTQAIELARRLGARDILSHALNNVGTVRFEVGDQLGRAQLEESLSIALAGDFHEHAARAFTNLTSGGVKCRDYAYARRWLDAGIAYNLERDLDSWSLYMLAWRARLHAEVGLWDRACDDAESVIRAPRAATVSIIPALAALGLVRVRRGEPDAQKTLDEALQLARPTAEAQRLVPVLSARAELSWFSGCYADVVSAVREAFQAPGSSNRSFDRDRLLFWLWRVDALGEEPPPEGPYARLIAGDWKGAAACWAALGCPYEQAEALVYGDQDAVQQALELFLTLGAAPAADWARQRLRHMGVSRVPRGRRQSTRAHPGGLTTREGEILTLVAQGLHNAEIAGRLFVSPKTVEHHVSSILGKLGVASREAAAARAREEGWLQ